MPGDSECSDCLDNDGDSLIDNLDFECTGIIDDDEASFGTGIPGDNQDPCKQDCFFDGNSGDQENCNYNLKCDAGYSDQNSCPYLGDGAQQCENQTPAQTCLDTCLPNVPNGCDCKGCCEVILPNGGGTSTVYLGSGPDCNVDNLENCETCTQDTTCVNDCDDQTCEICIGGQLPPGCEQADCSDFGTNIPTCEISSDCPGLTDFCLNGCCIPLDA